MKLLLTVVMLCTTALCNTDNAVEARTIISKAELARRFADVRVKCEQHNKPTEPDTIDSIVCRFQTLGVQNEDGTLNEAVIRDLLANRDRSLTYIDDFVKRCVVNGNEEDTKKTARKLQSCIDSEEKETNP